MIDTEHLDLNRTPEQMVQTVLHALADLANDVTLDPSSRVAAHAAIIRGAAVIGDLRALRAQIQMERAARGLSQEAGSRVAAETPAAAAAAGSGSLAGQLEVRPG